MSIVDILTSTRPKKESERVVKKLFNRPVSPAQEEIARRHLSLTSLSHREFIRLPQDVRDALDIQFSKRRVLLDYVINGIKESGITHQRPKIRVGSKSSLRKVRIPSYINPRDQEGNQLGKYVRFVDTKLALDYGSVDDPIRVHADILLFHEGQKYLGLFWRDLRRSSRQTYLHQVNKVGKNIFGREYGGFIIFYPTDDDSIDLYQPGLISTTILEHLAEESNTQRDLSHKLKEVQKKSAKMYRSNEQTKIEQSIYDEFEDLTHLIGLPYDISQRTDYFFHTTPAEKSIPIKKPSKKIKHKGSILPKIGYEGTDNPSVHY